MQIFNNESFHEFIGDAWLIEPRKWGHEWRFSVSKEKLAKFTKIFQNTLYHHHSFFNLYDYIAELGFSLSAQALKIRNSGNPKDQKTQMANLGEVLGAQFSRAYLDYQAKPIYPKRFNTNVEQSMKGIDVLNFKDNNSPPEILIGEVKTRTQFSEWINKPKKSAIEDAHETLCKHSKNEDLPIMLHFAKTFFQNDKIGLENVERHTKKNTPRKYLLLLVTESRPRDPFSNIPAYQEKYGGLDLLAIHIEIKGLREFLPTLFSRA